MADEESVKVKINFNSGERLIALVELMGRTKDHSIDKLSVDLFKSRVSTRIKSFAEEIEADIDLVEPVLLVTMMKIILDNLYSGLHGDSVEERAVAMFLRLRAATILVDADHEEESISTK